MIGFVIAQKMGRRLSLNSTLNHSPPPLSEQTLIAPQGSFAFQDRDTSRHSLPFNCMPSTAGRRPDLQDILRGFVWLQYQWPILFRSPLPLNTRIKDTFIQFTCRKFTNFQIGIIGYKITAVSSYRQARSHRCHITALQLKNWSDCPVKELISFPTLLQGRIYWIVKLEHISAELPAKVSFGKCFKRLNIWPYEWSPCPAYKYWYVRSFRFERLPSMRTDALYVSSTASGRTLSKNNPRIGISGDSPSHWQKPTARLRWDADRWHYPAFYRLSAYFLTCTSLAVSTLKRVQSRTQFTKKNFRYSFAFPVLIKINSYYGITTLRTSLITVLYDINSFAR